jgi:hypothetical protein
MKPSEKEVKYVMTRGFSDHYGPIEPLLYIRLAKQIRVQNPYDMMVFENDTKKTMTVSVNGYHADTDKHLPENKVVTRIHSLPIKKFWLKYDDYGDHWVGTFLFPEEY